MGSKPYRLDQNDVREIVKVMAIAGVSAALVAGLQFVNQLDLGVVGPVVTAALTVLDLLGRTTERRDKLEANTVFWRKALLEAGFVVKEGDSPIVPVMLGDAALAARMADRLLEHGIYVIGFSFPVVPQGQARIRTQLSAAHTPEQLERAASAFTAVGRELGIVK